MGKSHIVHPPLFAGGEGVKPPIKSSKSGRPGKTSTFRGGCWERGGEFVQGRGVAIFTYKIN